MFAFNNSREKILSSLFFLGLFFASLIPSQNPDLWFHLKSGEIFLQKGVIHQDVFSQATNRPWYPYEWLFQVAIYKIHQFTGFTGLSLFASLIFVAQIVVLWKILRRIFSLSPLLSGIISLFYFLFAFDFFIVRPLLVALLFLWITLYLILLYCLKNKNLLFISLPVVLLWGNLHSTVFLGPGLLLAFSVVSLGNFLTTKDKSWLTKTRTLSLFSLSTLFVSLLPPIGLTQYRLLWYFFQNRAFLGRFIAEWNATQNANIPFYVFLAITIAIIAATLWVIIITKKVKQALILLPLWVLIATGFIAIRNVVLAQIGLALTAGFTLSKIDPSLLRRFRYLLGTIVGVLLIALWPIYNEDRLPPLMNPPMGTIPFLKEHHLNGQMFNEFNNGGYLLYHLYPTYKVFIDGRADVYLCCEMHDVFDLAENKNIPNEEFKKILDSLWQKYNISFVVLGTDQRLVFQKVAEVLYRDPQWRLVFWSDDSQIFVKLKTGNDNVLSQFATIAATPYLQSPFRPGMEDKALLEYQKMAQIADSARTENAIGFLLLQKNQFAQARPHFEKAVKLDPTLPSPLMNLGELALKNDDLDTAISLYEKALTLSPNRGFIYIRLGDLYLQNRERQKAIDLWQKGLTMPIGSEVKKTLETRLGNLQ